jgi:methylenetetrahydrofolate reductase (NADH)
VRTRLADTYGPGRFGLSYELYPPKTEAGMAGLFQHVNELMKFAPSFITCTYGAGGSTQAKTLDIVEQVRNDYSIPVAAHLTCVGATAADLRAYLADATERGIEYIMALRGDPPEGETEFHAVEGGLSNANELVTLIRNEFPHFGVAVAGYPETHQEAPSAYLDLDYLKQKVDAGADVVISQLFFNNDDFFRFRDHCTGHGINVPIIPGILPVTNLPQIKRVAKLCGAKLPEDLLERLESHADNLQGQFDVGVYHATRQVELLVDGGCRGVHFYVLNKSRAAATIMRALTLPPKGTVRG